MMKKSITYFNKPGPTNTDETLKLAYEKALELSISNIVIASTHGKTAIKAAKIFSTSEFNIVAVTICEGYEEEGWMMTNDEKASLIKKGIKVLTCPHTLSGDVNTAITKKFGGKSINEIIALTLYRFSQGMKVCVEIILMAADAGLIPVDMEALSIAGTDEGADTAIVVKPSYSRKFLELKIREIISKPR